VPDTDRRAWTIWRAWVPTNLREFQEDTAFERFVLDRATPLLPTSEATSVIDLGEGGSTSISVTPQPAVTSVSVGDVDSTRATSDQLSIDDIRPLLFGAAWKVLDLLVELRLEQEGIPHNRRRKTEYSIDLKVRKTRDNEVRPAAPFGDVGDLWQRVMRTYASTSDLRHSLIHRQLRVDRSTGAIGGTPRKSGQHAEQVLTNDEQSAICRVAGGVADAVIEEQLTTRRADQLKWLLDQLTSQHGQPSFGVPPAIGLIPVVIVRPPPNEVTLDFADIRRRARSAVSDVSHYDLTIHLPDGRVLACPLEDAPTAQATFSTDSLPDWLREE
jgi:hypothetical protein